MVIINNKSELTYIMGMLVHKHTTPYGIGSLKPQGKYRSRLLDFLIRITILIGYTVNFRYDYT